MTKENAKNVRHLCKNVGSNPTCLGYAFDIGTLLRKVSQILAILYMTIYIILLFNKETLEYCQV